MVQNFPLKQIKSSDHLSEDYLSLNSGKIWTVEAFIIIIIIIIIVSSSSSSSSSSSIVVLDTTRMKILMSLRDRTAERKGVTVKRLCVTGLLLACFVMIFTYINVCWSFTKRSV